MDGVSRRRGDARLGFPMHNTHRLCSNPRVRERSWLDQSLQGAAARAMNKLTLGKSGPAKTQCCQSFGFYPNSTDFEGLVLCLFYAYSDFSNGFSVC